MKFILSSCLVLSFIINAPSAHAMASPELPEIIEVSPEMMEKLLKNPEFLRIARIEEKKLSDEEKEKKEEEQKKIQEDSRETFRSGNWTGENLSGAFSGNTDSEAALVIFAVMGLVVVIAWLPYFPILIHDVITNGKDKYEFRHIISTQYTHLTNKRSGSFTGGRYSFYAREKDKDDLLINGLTFESGYYLTKEQGLADRHERREGAYFLLGPSILLGADSFYGKADLMAGTSFDKDLGLITKADFSLNLRLDSGITFGPSIGAIYMNVKDHQGTLDSKNNLGLTFSFSTGYEF